MCPCSSLPEFKRKIKKMEACEKPVQNLRNVCLLWWASLKYVIEICRLPKHRRTEGALIRWNLLQVGGEYRSYRTFLHPYSVSARVCSNFPNFPDVETYISTLTAISTYPNCSDTALILSHFPYSQVHFEELSTWRNSS